MDYSQFFNMLPEATLMAVLVIVFLADMMVGKESKHKVLSILTGVLMLAQTGVCLVAESSDAFAGMYVATDAVNVMKIILTAITMNVPAVRIIFITFTASVATYMPAKASDDSATRQTPV